VVGSVFLLMQEYESVWEQTGPTAPAELFGFRYDVGLDPVQVNVDRMIQTFVRSAGELREIWTMAMDPVTMSGVDELARQAEAGVRQFHMDDELWARIVLDFACAYKRSPVSRGLILKSLTALYLARVASFVIETETMVASEVEERIEKLCLQFEELRPYLRQRWNNGNPLQGGLEHAGHSEQSVAGRG